jgi:hypothetical protein
MSEWNSDAELFELIKTRLYTPVVGDLDGVLIPDHAPPMTCDAPWHAGMAYACGWMKAALQSVSPET